MRILSSSGVSNGGRRWRQPSGWGNLAGLHLLLVFGGWLDHVWGTLLSSPIDLGFREFVLARVWPVRLKWYRTSVGSRFHGDPDPILFSCCFATGHPPSAC